MRIHLIAIGGAVMHNLALALHDVGHQVSGSDDEIYDPARTRLDARGLLPPTLGWHPERITPEIDLVILGMHARKDNPELRRAQELGLRVVSFPEFIGRHASNKTRIVVAGSHGKTTTTAMIMHSFKLAGLDFDYLVGAQLEGFDTMVRLSDAPLMVIEGDEYLSSALDPRPKFLHYTPQVLVLTGIAWDHINVFPTFESYQEQFRLLLDSLPRGAKVIYDERDEHLRRLMSNARADLLRLPYQPLPHRVKNGTVVLETAAGRQLPLHIFGAHNLANLNAARKVSEIIGIEEEAFFEAAATFKGAARRLQTLCDTPHFKAWLDFAHAPSKVAATVQAVKELFPSTPLTAIVELHTFSSLDKAFLPHYRHTLGHADEAAVFYSPHTLEMKKMPPISTDEIRNAFDHPQLQVFTSAQALEHYLTSQSWHGRNLLLMSSGNFGGIDVRNIVKSLENT